MILRAHSDTPAPLAAFSIAFNSDGVTRARTMQLFASPFGSFGRPILDFYFCATKILVAPYYFRGTISQIQSL